MKQNIAELPLSDLIAMYNNYWQVEQLQPGYRFILLTRMQFEALEHEIKLRVSKIDFTYEL